MFSNLILFCSSQLKPPMFFFFLNKLAWDTHDCSYGWRTVILLTICSKIAKAWGYFWNLDSKKMRYGNVKNWFLENVALWFDFKTLSFGVFKNTISPKSWGQTHNDLRFEQKTCVCSVTTRGQMDLYYDCVYIYGTIYYFY